MMQIRRKRRCPGAINRVHSTSEPYDASIQAGADKGAPGAGGPLTLSAFSIIIIIIIIIFIHLAFV